MGKPFYREQAAGEVHLISANLNLQQEVRNQLNGESLPLYLQVLHPTGPTRPTLENNRQKIKAVLMGTDIADQVQLVERIIEEVRELGIPFLVFMKSIEEEESAAPHLFIPVMTPDKLSFS